jgi:predicted TIM-barrel fold metal-dependent hydrolase
MELIDTHIHLWDLNHLTYSFLQANDPAEEAILGDYSALRSRNYLIADYLADIRDCGVAKAVHVQAALGHPRPVEETAWLQDIARSADFPHGIVGFCDLRADNVEEVLDAHQQFQNFRGIRMLGTGGMLEDARFQRGFACVAERGLVYDLEAFLADFPAAHRLASKFPGARIVLEHTGMPLQRTAEYFHRWRTGMQLLAGAENIVCKISGLGMTDHRWTVASIRPWVEAAIDAFGPQRCMFGTNWPVDSLYSSYRGVVDAYREIIQPCSRDEQVQLLRGTAETVYGI